MTINVCLVTHEAIVFGCDSVASRSAYFVDAFEFLKRDNGGEWAKTQDGKLIAEFDISKAKNLVTSAWGGVTKMFQVHGNPCPVAAVTAGLANLSNRNMATLAAEFAAQHDDNPLSTVEEVATAFLQFFREQFDLHYKDSQIPDDFKEGPLFMLGGFASNDSFPSLYKIDVKNNRFDLKCGGGASNIFWEGQSDAVERVLFGWDAPVRNAIEATAAEVMRNHHTAMSGAVVRILEEVLAKLGQTLPPDINTELPQVPDISLPWSRYTLPIDVANLPLQGAIDLISYLVLIQSGRSRFAEGVATVGGRTHIGVMRKHVGFTMLDEPALAHKHRGFADDL